tara:strand:- start:1099 stop:4386 length:3288 start_codon:yes stop_codon:yes gene_type:complete
MPTFYPKKLFTVSGRNMNFVERVLFGDEEVASLTYLDTTGVSGVVPPTAYTNDVVLEGNGAPLNLGVAQVVLDSASQVVVSGLNSNYVSGKAGDLMEVSGENFYQITDVKFGEVSGTFFTVSDQEMDVLVPSNADYGGITVFSSLRTGLNGSISAASGVSYNEFVPIPEVTGLSSGQLVSGDTLSIQGVSMSGVTGFSVNSIEFEDVTISNSTTVQGVVPSGNVRGVPNLLLQSGVSVEAPADIAFKPLAEITGIRNAIETGNITHISGKNFTSGILYSGIEYDRYLVNIGGQTGNFALVDDTRLTGVVPTGISIITSGGNIAIGPSISSNSVSLYSDSYPEEYPSNVEFTPAIGAPKVDSIFPASGLAGDVLQIQGSDLYSITGVNIVGANVGIGSEAISTIIGGVPGKSVAVSVSTSLNVGSIGESFNVTVSGAFGTTTVSDGFFGLGVPTITSITPSGSHDGSTNVEPGSTGNIIGTNLYSGTQVFLQDTNVAPSNFVGELPVSGYNSNNTEIVFGYPNTFQTGINYKLRVKNRRSYSTLKKFSSFKAPFLSGFEPLSGEFGESVSVSGYFEGIKESGLSIGSSYFVGEYSHPATTGFTFVIPDNALSDTIQVSTSGGFVSSSTVLGVSPNKPAISGFYLGRGEKPAAINDNQVFGEGDFMSVTGDRMQLVTGVAFSGTNSSFVVNSFYHKSPSLLTITVPNGINSGSGVFELLDFKGRKTSSPEAINTTKISGFSNYYLPGDTFTLSGQNVTGLNVNFVSPTGGSVSSDNLTNTTSSLGVETITAQVPTGIKFGNVFVSGRDNPDAATSLSGVLPLAVITGVTGFNASNQVASGSSIRITGLNSDASISSGAFAVGISGTGNANSVNQVYLWEISGFGSGSGIESHPNLFYNTIDFQIDSGFVGTGKLFINNPWDLPDAEDYPSSTSADYLANQVTRFPDDFIIQGTQVNVTGYHPNRGITGSTVEVSGVGFTPVTGVFFNTYSGEPLEASFILNSDSKITVTVPEEAVEVRGDTSLVLSGGTNDTVGNFEVLLDATVVEFEINDSADIPSSSTNIVNFTNRETVNGVVFLVTRTKFPDGTSVVVSSTPEV